MTEPEAHLESVLADTLAADGTRSATQVIALPSARTPRALLPVARRRAASRILRTHYGGGGLRRRLQTAALSALVACGLAARLPTWRAAPLPVPAERRFPAWARGAAGEGAHVGLVLLGPPRANRKPVVLLTDDSGGLVAVAKIGWNDLTRPLVAYEASALAEIAAALDGRVHVPTLLDARRLGDVEFMMMRPLPALDRRAALSRTALVETVRAVAEVSQAERAELRGCLGHERLQPLASAVARISARTSDVQFGSAHGDLHPGNLGVARDGLPVLWDWERWMHGVPVGFDLLHHDLQSWVVIERVEPEVAAHRLVSTAAAILAPLGVTAEAAPYVAKDYLVRLAARYVDDAQDEAGSRLGRVESWLFPAVLAD